MKKLTIEEKAKRYDEVSKEVKDFFEGRCKMYSDVTQTLEHLFPELNETDDEKIRKIISDILLIDSDEIREILDTNNVLMQDINVWLEKQGEHEYALKSSNNEDVSKLTEQITKLAKDYDFNLPNRSYDIYAFAKDILAWLEKQYKNVQGKSALEPIKEEKVDKTNKVEPKFKDGDWIVYKDAVWKVCNIGLQNYYDLLKINNEVSTRLIKDVDENAHLWSIEDAKDGDIIYAESRDNTYYFICIFSKLENEKSWVYCSVDCDSDYSGNDLKQWDFDEYNGFINLYNYNFYPATKEQRHLLYQKMKDEGYKWDAEKKELKKI